MFNIKNLASAGTVVTALLVVSPHVNAASASAVINISAKVVDNTCTPTWSKTGEDIDLGQISNKDFTGTGTTGKEQTFNLKLEQCGSNTTGVKVTAKGTADSINSGLFQNSEVSGAKNVGVAIMGGSTQSVQLKPDGSSQADYTVANNEIDMVFLARVVQAGDDEPTAGSVKSVVTLTIDYK